LSWWFTKTVNIVMIKETLIRKPETTSVALADAPTIRNGLLNPQFSTIELATGATLNYLEQGDADGAPVIMLHGYTDSWNTYALVLLLLSSKYHVFALDQRGHGNSSKAACCYTMSEFAADVIAFMDAKGIDQATVVGHSMGSMIAQLLAIHYPERLARLVLIGSMTVGGNDGVSEFNEAVQALVDPIDPAFVRDFQVSTLYRKVPAEFLDKVVSESLKTPAHVWRQALASFVVQNTTGSLTRISAPTLIFWGDEDPYFPRSDQEILSRKIPQATLLIYEQTGHNPHWEQPKRFVADFERFVQTTIQ
jgi:pimeloyl-ACP methyl ester carboxylesterase